ncbi:hypothetical protein CJ177_43475 [Rhodococcus sp. ACPA1]|nr:hypothetical protein CJ177_43475 [Rhodococcus sp. ACPA1]
MLRPMPTGSCAQFERVMPPRVERCGLSGQVLVSVHTPHDQTPGDVVGLAAAGERDEGCSGALGVR